MKRFITGLLALVTLLVGISACTMPTSDTTPSIVGDWAIYGTKVMTFTSSGEMDMYAGVVTQSYKYSASDGNGYYWLAASPSAKAPFTYTVTATTLTFSITTIGTTITYTRL